MFSLHLFHCCFLHFLPELVETSCRSTPHKRLKWELWSIIIRIAQSGNIYVLMCVCRSNSTKCAQNMHFFPPQSHKKVDILFMHWVFIFYKNKIEYIHCWSNECEFIRLPFENWVGIIYFQICFECLQNVEHSKCVDWTHLIKTKTK